MLPLELTPRLPSGSHSIATEIPLPDWWKTIEDDPAFQQAANYGLAGAYGLIAVVALAQLSRIQMRVPEYGWTTQKVFHLFNCLVCALRCGIFVFRPQVETLDPPILRMLLLDLPGLLFFTTYTLLVLFWAEIYHQARGLPTGSLRPIFVGMNVTVVFIQAALWTLSWLSGTEQMADMAFLFSEAFLALISLLAAVGFVVYGGRLYLMLHRFPIESRGRRKKLKEVGLVTTICAGCFTIRAVLIVLSATDRSDLEIDLLGHPLLNILYYTIVEIIPAASVLYILRKLPPKRAEQDGYQQIPSSA
eukprot:gene15966-22097_t